MTELLGLHLIWRPTKRFLYQEARKQLRNAANHREIFDIA